MPLFLVQFATMNDQAVYLLFKSDGPLNALLLRLRLTHANRQARTQCLELIGTLGIGWEQSTVDKGSWLFWVPVIKL
jgi:hypothetical protein